MESTNRNNLIIYRILDNRIGCAIAIHAVAEDSLHASARRGQQAEQQRVAVLRGDADGVVEIREGAGPAAPSETSVAAVERRR